MAKKRKQNKGGGAARGSGSGGGARGSASTAFGTIRVSRANLILAVAALAAITVGYVLLADGSTVGAPLLLVLGYAVLVPLAIMR